MRHVLSILMALALSAGVKAQDLQADMKRMVDKMGKSKGIALKYHIRAFDQLQKDQMTFEQRGYIKKYGKESISKVNNVLSIHSKGLFLMVDDGLKMMQLAELEEADEEALKELLKTDEIKKTAEYGKVSYQGVVGGKKHYKLTELGQMKEAHIYIDQKTGFLSRLIYYYDAKRFPSANKVIIDYHGVRFNYVPEAGAFSAKKYVVRKNKKYMPTKQYSTYQLIVEDHEN